MAIAAASVRPYSCAAMAKTVQSRAVERAAELLGGPEQLAARLGLSTGMVRAWIAGAVSPPDSHLLQVLDILGETGKGSI